MSNSIHFLGDKPISESENDLFNFKHYADKVQKLIQLNSSNPEPITFGVYGKWGEGKTSFLNLIKNKIEHFKKDENGKEYLKFNFNPWKYSSEDEMLFDFFDTLSKKFYVKENTNLQEVGKWILKYSKYLKAIKISSTVGITKVLNTNVEFNPDKIFEALGEDLKGEKITLESLKNKVNNAIKESNFKVVVFIDDLDRLDKDEIYTILKLIKLNANFDNFIFVVALDSEHIAKAIKDRYGNEIEDGYYFLEKIINIPIHLPRIENEDLHYFFEINLKKILNSFYFLDDLKKSELSIDLSSEILENYFRSPREIIKILNSFFITAFAIGEEINLKDLFWLEFIKVRNEKCYSFLKNYVEKKMFRNSFSQIDFGLDFEENKYEFRDDKFSEFEDVKQVLEKLFPRVNENYEVSKKESNGFNKCLNINSEEHYDKYFSYHMERKITNNASKNIEKYISESNSSEITIIIKELFNNSDTSNEHKIIYKIETIILGLENKEQRNFFFNYIFENIDLLPKNNKKEYSIKIIKLIGKILNEDIDIANIPSSGIPENYNKDICQKLANIAELDELTAFIRAFYESRKSDFGLIEIFIEKAKKYISDFPSFYQDSFNFPNQSIFYYFSVSGNQNFLISQLDESVKSIDDVKKLVRNFVPYYNSSFFGSIDKESYNEIKSIISVEFIYQKVLQLEPVCLEKFPIFKNGIEKTAKSNEDENLDQLIHWYLYEKNQNDKIDKILS